MVEENKENKASDNGKLQKLESKIKELESNKDKTEVREELGKLYLEKQKLIKPQEEINNFKVAEIWVKSGQVFLEATEQFWQDKCRALGLLELCKEIVKTAKPPKPKIITPGGNNRMLNYARNLFRKKR